MFKKKILAILAVLAMVLGLVACGNKTTATAETTVAETTAAKVEQSLLLNLIMISNVVITNITTLKSFLLVIQHNMNPLLVFITHHLMN